MEVSGSAGAGGRSGCPVVWLLGRVEVAQRARARGRVTGERERTEEVDVVVLEWGQPGDQVVGDREAAGGQVLDGRVDVQGVEQHHGVEGEAEYAELVFHSLPVALAQLAALPEEGLPGDP